MGGGFFFLNRIGRIYEFSFGYVEVEVFREIFIWRCLIIISIQRIKVSEKKFELQVKCGSEYLGVD